MSIHFKDHLQSRLREAVQAMLVRGLKDPRLDGTMVTITGVDLADDLRNATIRLSVYPEKAQKRSIAAMKHAEPHIRRHVADVLKLHSPPLLAFVLDTSTQKQSAVLDALARVAREREAREKAGNPPPGSGIPDMVAPRPNVGNASSTARGSDA